MKENEYKCDNCHEVFDKGWSDEEAKAEFNDRFENYVGEVAIVCDDCYKQIMDDV